MPEMPEVETIVRRLRRSAPGRRVVDVWLSGLPLRREIPDSFRREVVGRVIRAVRRRGKYILFELEPRSYCLVHLGMSGRLFHLNAAGERPLHTHAVIRLSDSSELQFSDPRRFGLLAFHDVRRIGLIPEIRALGVDPLSDRFTPAWLFAKLTGCRRDVKAFLLDQRGIAGLGNIYVLEALFRAGIHPARRCDTLDAAEAARLAGAVRRVIRAAVRHRGTSFSDFMDSEGRRGEHQRFLRVFQREGETCIRCRAEIERIVQSGRSSFYCPRCQR